MIQLYQDLKPVIMEVFGLSRDAIHMHVGFLAYLASFLWMKKSRFSRKVLVFPVGLSLLMELFDLVSDLGRVGRPFPWAYAHDLLNTNAIPVMLFFVLRSVGLPTKSQS